VAARVAAYQAAVQERLREAELERAAAETRAAEERKRRRLALALAAALLLLLSAGGGGAWLYQQQQQRADAAAALAMGRARLLLEQAKAAPLGDAGKFREALAAAEQAKELARTGGASEAVRQEAAGLATSLRDEAGAAERDRRLLTALLEVRRPREGPTFHQDDWGLMTAVAEPSADEQFAAAFAAWDPALNVDALPTAAAARLGGRPAAVVTEVVAALDEWAAERRRLGRPVAEVQRLSALAGALDRAGSRQAQLRGLLASGVLARERALRALSVVLRPVPVPFDAAPAEDRERLRRLAGEVEAVAEPVLGLLTLARALRQAGQDGPAEELLRRAVRARPQEVVLHYELGKLLEEQRPPRWAEAVECFAAARALRPELGEALADALASSGRIRDGLALYQQLLTESPDNPWLHLRHGNALYGQGRFKEAEAAHRAALRLQPDYAWAHTNLGNALSRQGRHKEAEAAYRAALRIQPDLAEAHNNLGNALSRQGRHQEAEAAYRAALRLNPDYPEAHNGLGALLYDHLHDSVKAEAAFREAIRLRPDFSEAYTNLGNALSRQGRHKEAEAAFREALRLNPDFAGAHLSLGNALHDQGRHQEAEAAFRAALRLNPDYPEAHNGLGALLYDHLHDSVKAEAAFREAIRLRPDFSEAHTNLGNALSRQGRHKEAEAAFREALRLNPDFAEAHNGLGALLCDHLHDSVKAEAAFREAIRLKPDSFEAHNNLGLALEQQGRYKEAEAAHREALRLNPDFAKAHYHLGNALSDQGRYAEAEAAYRAALRLRPDYAEAHCNLASALQEQGRFTEALEALRRGHELGSKTPGWRYPSADWVRQCERLVALDRRLPAVLRGEAEPTSAAERLEFAHLCGRYKRQHVTASRLYADAFAADPRLANDLRAGHRYNAACYAALAAAGQRTEPLPDKAALMLRRQALGWLRADLTVYTRLAGGAEAAARQAVRQRLAHWQQDTDLAAVRDPAALARLPDDERKAWRQFWDDVAALLKK
jgi:tetratricopeptide (TPR) repeat protein